MAHQAVAAPGNQPSPVTWPLVMLVHRTLLFLVWQAVIAGVHALAGAPEPWQASIAWWPIAAILTNLCTIGLLRFLARREGLAYVDLVGAKIVREHMGKDLLLLLVLLPLAGIIAMAPNLGLSHLLFGDMEAATMLFVLPLPQWAALAGFLFPLTIAFAELPTYFGYVMPRLAVRWGQGWALGLAALWLAAQHMTLPLALDGRYILWRLLMFIPFAIMAGLILRYRPRMMPYMMVVHGLSDLSLAFMVWQASAGG
ncbi:MAG: hypothetical protein ACOY94_26430 [Bacillota bacterium]